jgi:hypothetical protein
VAPELRQAFSAGHRAITVQIVDGTSPNPFLQASTPHHLTNNNSNNKYYAENLKLGATLPKGSSEAAGSLPFFPFIYLFIYYTYFAIFST